MNDEIRAAMPFFEFVIPDNASEYYPEELNARLSFFLTELCLDWKSKLRRQTTQDWLKGRIINFGMAVTNNASPYHQVAEIAIRFVECQPLPGTEVYGLKIILVIDYTLPLDLPSHNQFIWTTYQEPLNWFTRYKELVVMAMQQLEDDYLRDVAK